VQGDRAGELLYIVSGKVLATIVSESGKEALIAILLAGDFIREDCVDEPAVRLSTATAATDCEVAALPTNGVLRAFSDDLDFTKIFAAFLMQRNKQLKAALVDQMLLSSEKRLARLLLRLVPTEKEIEPDLVDILINQDMIARMVGTTCSRINEFMNKSRKLGHIE
jgi:CRP/FNR family transcriptional regulator, cyclic AMP receptor protein